MNRVLITLLATLVFTTALFAQRGARPQLPQATTERVRPNPAEELKTALNLTDAQLEAIAALRQTRHERAEAIFTEIQEKRQALNTLLDAASPDPLAVGNAAIALHTSQNKLKAEADWYLAELKKLLTGEQQVKLDSLIETRSGLLGFLGLGGPGGGPGGRGGGMRMRGPGGQ